jgi:LacI family transcriptional regulator
MIGVVIPTFVHHFFSSIISGVEDILYDKGYRMIITQSNEDIKKEAECVNILAASRVDGIFMSLASNSNNHQHLKNLSKRNIPLIIFDRIEEGLEASQVIVNDYEGAFQATEHLIFQGCKNIVHLSGPKGISISQNRENGYRDALKKHNISIQEHLILQSDSKESATISIEKLLNENIYFDGVFAVNDDTAIGAMLLLQERGKKVPQDVAIIGFGDDPNAKITVPKLSSISQPGFEMGQTVAQLFLDEIEKKEKNQSYIHETKILPTQLVIRGSSQRK